MFKRFTANYMALLCLLDIITIQLALWLAMLIRLSVPIGSNLSALSGLAPTLGIHFAVAIIWPITFLMLSVYTPRKIVRWIDEAQRVFLAHVIATLSLAGVLYLVNSSLPRLTFAYFFGLALLFFVGYRFTLRLYHRRGKSSQSDSVARILIAGAGKVGEDIVKEFRRQQWPGVEIVGFLDDDLSKIGQLIEGVAILGSVDDAVAVVVAHEVDEVLIALPRRAHGRLANLVALLQEQPVRIRVVPDYFELAFFNATVESLGGIPLIGLRDPAIDGFQRLVKRIVDILAAGGGLLVLSPVLGALALAVKLEDGGPIFYLAPRAGENGKPFHMVKFRSMVVDADKIQAQVNQVDGNGNIIHKVQNDPRVTRIGRFMRRTSIDELPQLWNVFVGDMSLVGPRPELPWLVEKYEPWQRKRFAVPQGITGWWQVNGRSDNLMHLHTEEDLYYIQNYSLWLDLRILWKTVGVVLKGKGAY